MDELLEQLIEENRHYTKEGAWPITSLSLPSNQDDLGIYVVSSDGKTSFAGDFQKRFTIQSIVKPLFLLLALMDNGEEMVRATWVWRPRESLLTPSTTPTRLCSANILTPWSIWRHSAVHPYQG